MYTSAMFINNRAFFPGQEFGSLSTWQAYIRAPKGAVVIMSGDTEGKMIPDSDLGESVNSIPAEKVEVPSQMSGTKTDEGLY